MRAKGSGALSERLLFQKLSVALFVPLAAPLAELYAAALLRIFEETQRHQELLSWEYCVTLIAETIVETEAATQANADSSAVVETWTLVQEPLPVHTLNGTSADSVYPAKDGNVGHAACSFRSKVNSVGWGKPPL